MADDASGPWNDFADPAPATSSGAPQGSPAPAVEPDPQDGPWRDYADPSPAAAPAAAKGAAQPAGGSVVGDAAKGAGRGLLEAMTIDAATAPLDLSLAAVHGANWLYNKATGNTAPVNTDTPVDRYSRFFHDKFNQVVPAAPDSAAGRYSESIARAVPAAVAMPGSVAKNIALQAVLPGAASEAAGDLAKGTDYEAAARLAGGVLGGAAGAGAAGVGRAAAAATVPFRAAGREAAVGDRLVKAAANPDAVVTALDAMAQSKAADGSTAIGRILPDAQPTLAALAQDKGLAAREQVLRTHDNLPFAERAAQHNDAEVSALPTSDGAAENLPAGLNAKAADIGAGFDRQAADATAAGQQQAAGIGGTDSTSTQGQRIQESAQAPIGQAAAARDAAVDPIGGRAAPDVVGAQARSLEVAGESAAKARRRAAFDMYDPNLHAVSDGLPGAANGVLDSLDEYSVQPAGAEARLLQQMQNAPDVMSFKKLGSLNQSINAARTEAYKAGNTPAYARLGRLKDAVQSAISNAPENQERYFAQMDPEHPAELSQASREADAAGGDQANPYGSQATGTDGMPVPGARPLTLPVGAPNPVTAAMRSPPVPKAPQDLISFARAAGGLKDEGGDLASAGLGQRYRGLINNKTGTPLDRFRESAAEQGYLGADTDHAVGSTDVNDLIDALHDHPRYSVRDEGQAIDRNSAMTQRDAVGHYKDAAGDMKAGLLQSGIDPKSINPDFAHQATQLMVHQNMPWREALEQAGDNHYADLLDEAHETQQRDAQAARYQHPSLGDEGEGSGQGAAPAEPGSALGNAGEARPNLDAQNVAAFRTANALHADYARTYRQGDTAKRLATEGGYAGNFKMRDSAVPASIFTPGPQGGERMRAYLRAAGDTPDAAAAAHNLAGMSFRDAAVDARGQVDTRAARAWLDKHGEALNALPGGAQTYGNAADAQAALDRFAPITNAPTASALPGMFFRSGPQGAEAAANLAQLVGKPAADAHIADIAASRLRDAAYDPKTGLLDTAETQRFVDRNQDALGSVPGLTERLSTAAGAQRMVSDIAAQRKQALDTFQSGAVAKVMGLDDLGDIAKTVGSIYGRQDAAKVMGDLAAKARAAGPDAFEGLRKANVDHIRASTISNQKAMGEANKVAANKMQTLAATKAHVLSKVFTPEEVANIQRIDANIARNNSVANSARVPGQSATAQLLPKVQAHGGHGNGSLLQEAFFANEAAEGIGHAAGHFAGHIVGHLVHGGALAGILGKKALNVLSAGGIRKMDDLEREAYLHPEVGLALMRKAATPAAKASAGERLARAVTKLSPYYGNVQNAGSGNDAPAPARAAGGRVEPTDAQKEAGNYAKDHTRFAGLGVTIENRKGSTRSGKGADGKPWSVKLPADYGYIKGTLGADGDHVDCYIGPDENAPYAFVVNQMDLHPRRFDEHKVMLGFRSRAAAVETYAAGFSDGKGRQRVGSVRAVPIERFPAWVKSGATKKAA